MGFPIANWTAPLVPPPGAGFVTVMELVPDRCNNDGGIVTDSVVEETYTVARLVAPLAAAEFAANPVPVKVTVAAVGDTKT